MNIDRKCVRSQNPFKKKKHRVNDKYLKGNVFIDWKQAKEIIRKYLTCSSCNQTPSPAESGPSSTKRKKSGRGMCFLLQNSEN